MVTTINNQQTDFPQLSLAQLEVWWTEVFFTNINQNFFSKCSLKIYHLKSERGGGKEKQSELSWTEFSLWRISRAAAAVWWEQYSLQSSRTLQLVIASQVSPLDSLDSQTVITLLFTITLAWHGTSLWCSLVSCALVFTEVRSGMIKTFLVDKTVSQCQPSQHKAPCVRDLPT